MLSNILKGRIENSFPRAMLTPIISPPLAVPLFVPWTVPVNNILHYSFDLYAMKPVINYECHPKYECRVCVRCCSGLFVSGLLCSSGGMGDLA